MSEAARTAPAAAELPPLQGAQLLLLSIAIAASTFMEILDTTIVNVSVPAIAGSLGVSPSEATWTVSSYALAAAIVQPLTGWLGRRFGEVRVFVTSMLLFVATSAACGAKTSCSRSATAARRRSSCASCNHCAPSAPRCSS